MTGTDEPRDFFEIPAHKMAKFTAAIEKMSKKSMKLLGKPIIAFIDGTEDRKVEMPNGQMRMIRFNLVELQAEMPIVDGYRFVAKLDHTTEGGTIIRKLPSSNVEVPARYRDTGNTCEHCNVSRRRRDTFLLYNETTDEFRQVGSTCLQDFFGHDVHAMAAYAELLSVAYEAARGYSDYTDYDGENGHALWIDLEAFLQSSAAVIRTFGWTSSKAAYADPTLVSTRQRAADNFFHRAGMEYISPTAADVATAEAAIDWARSLNDKERLSDYEHNIAAIANSTMIENRHMGLAASIVGVYLMNVARQQKRDAEAQAMSSNKPSNHFGDIKTRYRDIELKITMVRVMENDFGISTLFKGITRSGDIMSWFTQGNITDSPVGSVRFMTGTVVKHTEYNNIKETGFNRVVLTPQPTEAGPKGKRAVKVAGPETIEIKVTRFTSLYPQAGHCIIDGETTKGEQFHIETNGFWVSGPGTDVGCVLRVTGLRSSRAPEEHNGVYFSATKVEGVTTWVDTLRSDRGGSYSTGRTDGLPKGYRI